MPINKINQNAGQLREVTLSDLRSQRQAGGAREWSTDNLRILATPQEKSVKDADAAKLKKDYKYSQHQKARFDLNKSLGDIVHAKPAKEAKESLPSKVAQKAQQKKDKEIQFRDKLNGTLNDVARTDKGPKLPPKMSQTEFMAKEKATATHLNSTVLKPGKETPGDKSIPSTSKEQIASDMKMDSCLVGKDGKEKTATIGSFNIEWLGQKKRSPEDYKKIAKVIKDSDAALLGVQEIADIDGLKQVMKHLPEHGYILGKSGNQMVGMIFDKNRVKYDAKSIQVLDDVTLGNPHMRPPLSVDVKVDNFDFNFTVMHLKAGFKDRSINIRNQQADKVNQWIQQRQQNAPDKDMIIVGDYNDFNNSPTLQRIDRGNAVDFATDEAKKGFYTNIRYRSVIDHAAMSNTKGGAGEEYVKGSIRTIDENQYDNYKHSVSDHKPIFFDVKSGRDRD